MNTVDYYRAINTQSSFILYFVDTMNTGKMSLFHNLSVDCIANITHYKNIAI